MESRFRFTPMDEFSPINVVGANLRKEDLKELVLQALESGESLPDAFLNDLSVSELLAHLKLSHRYYLNTKLPEIEQSIFALYDQKTKADKLLVILCSFFIEYKNKFVEHIKLEERVLFPYIDFLQQFYTNPKLEPKADFMDFSIQKFEESHSNLEEDLARIRHQITNSIKQIKTPLPFRIFTTQLEFFENDMAVHAYLEDEVLIPKIAEMERFFKGKLLQHLA